ncbi:MAG TPA: DUF1801 domain-containing protein [Ferruginibacter sp.]|nr:DUF1801 domain-containing protein [Ferruginibacter sp.]HMP21003.1 DUF1801 domain-containing protein [Ferruginibacter sp.]
MTAKVDAWIEALPEAEQQIARALRKIIFSYIPGVEEKLSFKLPFYHYYGMFCYINTSKEGIYLAFCRGAQLTTAFPHLEIKGRTIIASVAVKQLKDITLKNIPEMLAAAAHWNEEAKRNKIPFLKKKKIKQR